MTRSRSSTTDCNKERKLKSLNIVKSKGVNLIDGGVKMVVRVLVW